MNKKRQLTLQVEKVDNPKSVIYVMSRDQRIHDNHALLFAQQEADEKKLPLVIVFNILAKTGFRSREQFSYMITGLKEVAKEAQAHNITFVVTMGEPVEQIVQACGLYRPATVFFDMNPLRGPRATQKAITARLSCSVQVVDTHNIIPLWVLSDKEEYAAHTIRNKVHKQLADWLVEPQKLHAHKYSHSQPAPELDWSAVEQFIEQNHESGQAIGAVSGEKAAHKTLKDFIATRLQSYAEDRNVPTLDGQSNLSPYLHFGHISSLRVALDVIATTKEIPLLFKRGKLASYEGDPEYIDNINAFIEELVVRKELADNYCFYNDKYDSLEGAKDWAKKSIEEHRDDVREFTYTQEEWEQARTHDEAWNAAQKEMMKTGKMHGYMRMYWAKKILEFSDSPEAAISTAVYLNDKYSIDGGDPNGYNGVMWSIAGVHDRPWFDRAVFGKIRYMNRGGLDRRFKTQEYIAKWL